MFARAGQVLVTAFKRRDAFGRVVTESRAGTLIERTLDEAGNLLAISTGGANRIETSYDGRGQVLKVSKPAIGAQVSYGYDPDGRVLATKVTRQAGGDDVTTYGYDGSGRMQTRTRPGSIPEQFTYDPDDTVATATDRVGLTLTTTHDAANRITRIVPSGTPSGPARLAPLDGGDVITYDALGRVTSQGVLVQPGASSPDPSTLITTSDFDTRGLPRSERIGSWPSGSALERRYDAFGNPTSTMLPQGIAGSQGFPGYACAPQ